MSSRDNAQAAAIAWGNQFYRTTRWRNVRQKALRLYGEHCHKCNATPHNKPLHVDHIKPRSKHPQLSFAMTNLQILCEKCNSKKGNKHITDYRPKEHKILAERYAKNPTNLKHLILERQVGVEEVCRRREQAKKDRKENPSKDKKTRKRMQKDHKTFLRIQKQFLSDVRLGAANGVAKAVLNSYRERLDERTFNRLLKLCNVEHYLA